MATGKQQDDFMFSSQRLHTVARRYCQLQANYWYQIATELRQTKLRDPSSYRQVLSDSYARSNVLMVICTEIERLNPDQLADLEYHQDVLLFNPIYNGCEGPN